MGLGQNALSSIGQWWAKLEGSVHPADMSTFAADPEHTFNLKFPPPAFIGAIETAPIVILMSNGGYKPGVTEAEFPNDGAVEAFRLYLRGEIQTLPPTLARYYVNGPFSEWLSAGLAVLVNAVPYRSPQLSKEQNNQEVARHLPTLKMHRQWMMEEVLPEAVRGRRFLFVHRNGWWGVPERWAGPCVQFSDSRKAEPNRPAPDQTRLELARKWLRQSRC